MTRNQAGGARRLATCLVLLLGGVAATGAVPVTYVHATDPSCDGNSPCFPDVAGALQSVDDGGTVVLVSDISGSIRDTEGRQNITLMGITDTIEVSTQILLEETVTGWTIRDLEMTTSCIVEDVAGSLTIDNVTANIIKVGDLTQDTTAAIVVRDSTVRNGGTISVAGAPGSSLGGSVLIENNVAGSVHVKLNVAAGPPTLLSADVTIVDNQLIGAGDVSVVGLTTSGAGGIAGDVEYSRNVSTAPNAKFGVITFGNVTGDISGHVTFRDNVLDWLALLTTGSIAGSIGGSTIIGNTLEAIELLANDGAINGPVVIHENAVLDLGGHTGLDNPLILVEGENGVGAVAIERNTAPDADVVARSLAGGTVFGPASLIANSAGLLTLDSQGGDFGQPFVVIGNTLDPSNDPALSRLTVRTMSGGDAVGGTLRGNSADELTVNLDGFLVGDLTVEDNLVRELAIFVGTGNLGGATSTVTGNDFRDDLLVNGLDSLVRFNRFGGGVTVSQGTAVDATLNWWGCNAGPGMPNCSAPQTSGFPVAPWLTFAGEAVCAGSRAVASFDVRTASNGSSPAGNVTPGSVVVTTPDGVVLDNPVALRGGAGCSSIEVQPGEDTPSISMQLDSETAMAVADCTSGATLPPCTVFADGFESGDTSSWNLTQE